MRGTAEQRQHHQAKGVKDCRNEWMIFTAQTHIVATQLHVGVWLNVTSLSRGVSKVKLHRHECFPHFVLKLHAEICK